MSEGDVRSGLMLMVELRRCWGSTDRGWGSTGMDALGVVVLLRQLRGVVEVAILHGNNHQRTGTGFDLVQAPLLPIPR